MHTALHGSPKIYNHDFLGHLSKQLGPSSMMNQSAFIHLSNRLLNLMDMISPKSGWTVLYSADLIAEDGSIVGYGVYKGKNRHFVMTPVTDQ